MEIEKDQILSILLFTAFGIFCFILAIIMAELFYYGTR